jgi:serine/threonine protein kinase
LYGQNVDIYSLGLILYRLFNDNRMPFLPPHPVPITRESREEAFTRRIGGERFERPKNAEGKLAHIILKACAYRPENRYATANEMRQELQSLSFQTGESRTAQSKPKPNKVKTWEHRPKGKKKTNKKKSNRTKSAVTVKIKAFPEIPTIWKKIALYSSATAAILMTIITSTWLILQIISESYEPALIEIVVEPEVEVLPVPIISSIDPPIHFPGPATWSQNASITLSLHGISSADIFAEPGSINGDVIETIWGNAVMHYLHHFEIDAANSNIYWLKVRSHSGIEGFVRSTFLEAIIHESPEFTKNIVFDSFGSGWYREYNNGKRVVHVEYNASRIIDWHQVFDENGTSIEEITYNSDGSFSEQIR